MKLNHLGISVTDVKAACAFLEKYFGLRPVGKPSDRMGHLQDDDGLILSLFRGPPITDPETTHIGFMQENDEQVNAIHRRLTEDGFDPPAPERSHGWTFVVVAPGGFAIEVVS
ncbi:MAG: VOC family protein [Verrucomicrobiae bacterium]|nr:VOC family protein [Verrucomicrobiae bacterium]